MNTPAREKYTISAKFLGPIFSLDDKLSNQAQNLIFARNGTGKSFLSRAFRVLDIHAQGKDISNAAFTLVSEEAENGVGQFSFYCGTDDLGSLNLNCEMETVSANISNTIFHVFSEDFVSEELREREYQIDGEIENQIAIDSQNFKVIEAREALEKAENDQEIALAKLISNFEVSKEEKLLKQANISRNLKEYRDLDLKKLLLAIPIKPEVSDRIFATILIELDGLKSIPTNPDYPVKINVIQLDNITTAKINSSLSQLTSPSSVSKTIKDKIDINHDFYQKGLRLLKDGDSNSCPFCEQEVTHLAPKTVIEGYLTYFADEEEKHKQQLNLLLTLLSQIENAINTIETEYIMQRSKFETLKQCIPSMKNEQLSDSQNELQNAKEAINQVKITIQQKALDLTKGFSIDEKNFISNFSTTNNVLVENYDKFEELYKAIQKIDQERLGLQREACNVFAEEFILDNWLDIETIREFEQIIIDKESDLQALERENPSSSARDRVAETFQLLLKYFFREKYSFENENFILKRNQNSMPRGAHRTLSDGEKTVIAFCYFIASTHLKVSSTSDYKNLFYVFDDPVTSMSYDYVFGIAQILKSLSVSNQGILSINLGIIDGQKCWRPNLLILTHSNYFFNILRTNSVVKKHATFSLNGNGCQHNLTRMNNFVIPFEQQLEHIYKVAKGKTPEYYTANAIRSVLEAVGKFCRPDKTNLQDFITYLSGEEDFEVSSLLINSLSHGNFEEIAPNPDEIVCACKEAVDVVEKYAIGQIELIKAKEAEYKCNG